MTTRLYTLVALLLLMIATPTRALKVTGLGFSFEIPDDWRPIPREIIRETLEPDADPATSPALLMAFEPVSHQRPFQYPYITVRTIPHKDGRIIESLTAAQIRAELAALAEIPEERFLRRPSPRPAAGLEVAEIPDDHHYYYIHQPPSYIGDAKADAGDLTIHARQIGYVGRSRNVVITFASREEDFEESHIIVNQIARTFLWQPGLAPVVDPGFWATHGSALLMAILCFFILVLIGIRLFRWYRSNWNMQA